MFRRPFGGAVCKHDGKATNESVSLPETVLAFTRFLFLQGVEGGMGVWGLAGEGGGGGEGGHRKEERVEVGEEIMTGVG